MEFVFTNLNEESHPPIVTQSTLAQLNGYSSSDEDKRGESVKAEKMDLQLDSSFFTVGSASEHSNTDHESSVDPDSFVDFEECVSSPGELIRFEIMHTPKTEPGSFLESLETTPKYEGFELTPDATHYLDEILTTLTPEGKPSVDLAPLEAMAGLEKIIKKINSSKEYEVAFLKMEAFHHCFTEICTQWQTIKDKERIQKAWHKIANVWSKVFTELYNTDMNVFVNATRYHATLKSIDLFAQKLRISGFDFTIKIRTKRKALSIHSPPITPASTPGAVSPPTKPKRIPGRKRKEAFWGPTGSINPQAIVPILASNPDLLRSALEQWNMNNPSSSVPIPAIVVPANVAMPLSTSAPGMSTLSDQQKKILATFKNKFPPL